MMHKDFGVRPSTIFPALAVTALAILPVGTSVVLATASVTGFSLGLPREQLRPTDQGLERRIRAALSNDDTVRSSEIVVTVFDSDARLNGVVDTAEEKARAESIVDEVDGVRKVDNEIEVAKAVVPLRRSDEDVMRKIAEGMAEILPEEHDVEVRVEDGSVRLKGRVADSGVRRRLSELAFHAGAVLVKNELSVESE